MNCQEFQRHAIQSALDASVNRYNEIENWKRQEFEKTFEQMSLIFPALEKSDNYTFLLYGDRFTFRRTGHIYPNMQPTYCLETLVGLGWGYPIPVYDLRSYGEFLLSKDKIVQRCLNKPAQSIISRIRNWVS